MSKKIIIVAGASASGKTRYANYLVDQLNIPLLSKDTIREVLYDSIQFNISSISENQNLGACAYSLLYYFAEVLMKSDVEFIMESNFTKASELILQNLMQKYNYSCMTIIFDAPLEILHQRFINRENTEERHIGLSKGLYNDYENFRKVAINQQDFDFGNIRKKINVSDFNKVDYESITNEIKNYLD